jgi:four helix bundle protein
MSDRYIDFTELSSYKLSYELSNLVLEIVLSWEYFARDTVGKQLVRSCDSISANIAEGYGRYTKKDKIHFYRYSFASLNETKSWLNKSNHRKLISNDVYNNLLETVNKLPKEINTLIKYTENKLKY